MALAFAACNRGASDFDQAELDLSAVFVDRLHFDEHVIAEAELAAARLAAEAMRSFFESPEIAADRRHRNESLHENRVELDEDAERQDAGDDPGELLPDFVAHEDDFLPLQHFARRFFRAALA